MFYNGRNRKAVFVILAALLAGNVLAWLAVSNLGRHKFLEVSFFNVGQGDSVFIETPNGNQILIDGGPDANVLEKLSQEMPFYDRTIDLIILTHPEKDHLSGLLEVLKKYKIINVLWTGITRKTPEYEEWQKLVKEEDAEIIIAKAGQRIILQDDPFIFIDILYPSADIAGKEFSDSNDTSVVAQLVFSSKSFLFTGDISQKIESGLIGESGILDSDVLKIAHHGSKTAFSPEFINAVSPEIAVICVGKNNYGHPSKEVLANLAQFGIQVLRTDKDGDIKFLSDGVIITFKK